MTKKWSNTASMDGQTKRGASKTVRREEKRNLLEEMFAALAPDVKFVDVTQPNNRTDDEQKRSSHKKKS